MPIPSYLIETHNLFKAQGAHRTNKDIQKYWMVSRKAVDNDFIERRMLIDNTLDRFIKNSPVLEEAQWAKINEDLATLIAEPTLNGAAKLYKKLAHILKQQEISEKATEKAQEQVAKDERDKNEVIPRKTLEVLYKEVEAIMKHEKNSTHIVTAGLILESLNIMRKDSSPLDEARFVRDAQVLQSVQLWTQAPNDTCRYHASIAIENAVSQQAGISEETKDRIIYNQRKSVCYRLACVIGCGLCIGLAATAAATGIGLPGAIVFAGAAYGLADLAYREQYAKTLVDCNNVEALNNNQSKLKDEFNTIRATAPSSDKTAKNEDESRQDMRRDNS